MLLPRPVPLPVPRVGGRGGAAVACLGDVSFPVIFVLFRFAPELNISSGIMRFICVVLLAYLAAFPLSLRHHSARFPRYSCRVRSGDVIMMSSVMSSISAGCLLTYRVMSSPSSFASPFPGSPPRRLVFPPRLSCRGTGSRRGCLLRDVMPASLAVGVACFGCDAMAMIYLSCLASSLSVLLLRM